MAPTLSSVVEDIGFGWAQLKLAVLGGGVWAADGAELLLLGAVTNAVQDEWHLSGFQRSLVMSVIFLGVLIGNCTSGWVGDQYGRRDPIVASYLGVFLFSILSVSAWNFVSLASFRFFVGFSFGVGQPAWATLAGETTPEGRRALQLTMSSSLFALGEIYSASLMCIDDPSLKHVNWRWLIVMGSIPSGVLHLLSFGLLPESPYFLAVDDKPDEAKEVLKSLARSNCRPHVQTDFQVVAVPIYRSQTWREKLSVIFGEHLLLSTVVLAFSTFNLNFIFYGGLYAFPQIFPSLNLPVSPAMNLLLGGVAELPGALLGVILGTFMRRKSNMMVFCVGMTASLLCILHGLHGERNMLFIQIGFLTSKIMICVGFAVVYVYSTEIYPTSCRTTGSSICIAGGRIGALVCPIVFEAVSERGGSSSMFFYLMTGFCIVNGFLFFMLPYETLGKALPEDLEATARLVDVPVSEKGEPMPI